MKNIKSLILLVVVATFLTACSASFPVVVTDNPVGTKVGKSSYTVFLGFIQPFDANAGIAKAAEDGGITKIATVDFKIYGGMFKSTYTTIVTGE